MAWKVRKGEKKDNVGRLWLLLTFCCGSFALFLRLFLLLYIIFITYRCTHISTL